MEVRLYILQAGAKTHKRRSSSLKMTDGCTWSFCKHAQLPARRQQQQGRNKVLAKIERPLTLVHRTSPLLLVLHVVQRCSGCLAEPHACWGPADVSCSPCCTAGRVGMGPCSSAARNSLRRLRATWALTSWLISCGSWNRGIRSTCGRHRHAGEGTHDVHMRQVECGLRSTSMAGPAGM